MGLSVNSQDTFKYVMEEKKGLPESEQPYLLFRYLSARDCSKVERLFAEATNYTADEDILSGAIKAIKVGLVGWAGYELPFNVDDVDAVLTRPDIIELRGNLINSMTISQMEKKTSGLRLQSISDNSVKQTEPATA